MEDLHGNNLAQGDRVEHADGTRIGTVKKLMGYTALVSWDDNETYCCRPTALVKISEGK